MSALTSAGNNKLWLILLCLCSIMFEGCAALNTDQNEFINELIIRNDTNSALYDVTLRVPEKDIIVSTNFILPYREYSLGFPALENKRNRATLSWVHNGMIFRQEIKTEIPINIDKNKTSRVVIRIRNDGQMHSAIETP